jgi:hypothetical protein
MWSSSSQPWATRPTSCWDSPSRAQNVRSLHVGDKAPGFRLQAPTVRPQVVAAARQNVVLAGFMYPCKALKGRPAAEEGLDPRLLHCSSTVHAAGLCNRSDERPGNCFSTLTGISSAGVSSLRRPSQPKACRWERPTRPSARGAVRAAGERPGRACSSTRRVWSANGNQPDGFMPSPCGQALVVTTEFAEPSRRRCGQELAVPLRYLHQLRSTPLVHLP